MAEIYQNIGQLILMLALLGCSAFFSGSETAFFNLSRKQINSFKKSANKLDKLVAKILNQPRKLLSCLLFGNMVVNILYFATASVLIIFIQRQIGITAAAVTAFLSFAILVMFGEILPKAIAYANCRSISIAAALPAFLCVQVFGPIVFAFRLLLVEPILRLLLGPPKHPKPITTDEFRLLVEAHRKRGLITPIENKLLAEIVELGFLRTRHVMQPRVDMISCSAEDGNKTAIELMKQNRLTKLPVYKGVIDNIIGIARLRNILLEPTKQLIELIEQVNFVPEQKTVESLLDFFQTTGTDLAIVVDEYGGLAGMVKLEDIAEELFGPIEANGQAKPMEQLGPFTYRLAGDISIHDWAASLGLDQTQTRVSTIGGLVTALLGRIAKSGDVAFYQNLKFTVEKVHRHRIESLILSLESMPNNDS